MHPFSLAKVPFFFNLELTYTIEVQTEDPNKKGPPSSTHQIVDHEKNVLPTNRTADTFYDLYYKYSQSHN